MDDPSLWRLLLLLLLVLINAVFTMSEMAIVNVNDNKIKRMAEEGHPKAKLILSLVSEPTAFLSTIQIMVTLAGFLASAFAANSFVGPFARLIVEYTPFTDTAKAEGFCLILITVLLSYMTLIFGELVPKRIGMHRAEDVAFALVGVIVATGKLMKPFVYLLTQSSEWVLRLAGIDTSDKESDATEEEIRMMVDIGEEKGLIAADEKELITNVFEFNNKEAADVMTHRTDLCMIWIDEEPDDIRRMILENGFSRFPVYDEDGDDILGVLHLRDYLSNMLAPEPLGLRELLRPAYFIPEQVTADMLFRDMQRQKIHLAVVVDEYGGTRGIVTMEDLLEEIVGNIYDEYDATPDAIQKIDDTTWRVPGSAELEQLEDIFGIILPRDEFDTLGGLVFSRLRAIPEDGTTPVIEAYGLRVQVEEILDRRVEWALVSKQKETPANAAPGEVPSESDGS